MKRSKGKKTTEEYNFWQPSTDMMTGIVFVLMLVVALLCLYILNTYNSDYDDEVGNDLYDEEYEDEYESETPTPTPSATEYVYAPGDNSGGGGDDDGDGEGEVDEPITEGFEEKEEEGAKAAVLVRVVDDETGNLIREAGIQFRLYDVSGTRQSLRTYYPEKITYTEFETQEDGTFYLPEKIDLNEYYFSGQTAPDGYDPAEDVSFVIDAAYDWSNPYTVTIPLSPCKNSIRVQELDAATGEGLAGGSYQVVAAEDVTTLDGTVRYTKGEVVDTIVCDEEGNGESIELYLGNYLLRQEAVPDYYASLEEELEVEVGRKTTEEIEVHELALEKTTITVSLTDELTATPLADVSFTVSADSSAVQTQTLTTNTYGTFEITNLEKGVTYRIRQTTTPEDYLVQTKEYTVAVDADGRIEGSAETGLQITNRLLRVSVSLVDRVLGSAVTGEKEVHLYNSADTEVATWVSTGATESLEGLAEGDYYIILDDNVNSRYSFHLANTAEQQSWQIEIITALSIAAIAGIALAVLLVLALVIFLIRRFWKRRRKKQ